jgi:hypothetical protein
LYDSRFKATVMTKQDIEKIIEVLIEKDPEFVRLVNYIQTMQPAAIELFDQAMRKELENIQNTEK